MYSTNEKLWKEGKGQGIWIKTNITQQKFWL